MLYSSGSLSHIYLPLLHFYGYSSGETGKAVVGKHGYATEHMTELHEYEWLEYWRFKVGNEQKIFPRFVWRSR